MKVSEGPLSGLLIIQPDIFTDNRGYFYEVYQQDRYAKLGLPNFVQDNLSRSMKNVLRGLHYQQPKPQGKLVWVVQGEVWDVVVDIRRSSPTFGKFFNRILSDVNQTQLYIPPGFAHGFCVLSSVADFYYKCTDYYSPINEKGIKWNDPALSISWPVNKPILSPKDNMYLSLSEIPENELFP